MPRRISTPLEAARAALLLVELVYEARADLEARGVQLAESAPLFRRLGRELAQAVEAAEIAPEGEERLAALARVDEAIYAVTCELRACDTPAEMLHVTRRIVRGEAPRRRRHSGGRWET